MPRDYASNPAISADGRHVAYEAYRQKLPLAVRFGEIAVMRADVRTGRTDSSRVRWQPIHTPYKALTSESAA